MAAIAKTPASTGAQHVVAIAERMPRKNTDIALCFFNAGCTWNGREKRMPVSSIIPREKRSIPPPAKITLWYSLKNFAAAATPSPIGRKTAVTPRKKINVIKNTRDFSRNIDPKYAGRSTVMQQGAKSAAIPATNATIRDVLVSISTEN